MEMKRARVTTPLVELRREAEFESERLTQLLFNEELEVENLDSRYVKTVHPQVKTDQAWVYARHLEVSGAEEATDQSSRKICVPLATVFSDDKEERVTVLPFGAEVVVWKTKNEKVQIGTPKIPYGWISGDELIENEMLEYSPESLLEYGKKFLGVPYLWGGTTPFGFDCSGLVLRLFGFYGTSMPNYTELQKHFGTEISLEDIRIGDLLFFPDHVAIYAGDSQILHANLLRGGVSLDSMNPAAPNYHFVAETIETIKRIEPESV